MTLNNSNLPYDPKNEQQKLAYDLIAKTNVSFFLTGRAGTGKTTFLRKVRETVDKNFVVVAPTGIAAIVAGGETIHSFFGMPIEILTPNSCFNINETKQRILRRVDTIIVDEASMVRCDMVDAMDRILRTIMRNNLPFGGKQMVFSGDVFQLDPVVKRNSTEMEILKDLYNLEMPYFYKANVFERAELISVEFQKVYRQEDEEFLKILTNIRNGKARWADINRLNERVGQLPKKGELAITLTSTNKIADEINQGKLNEIEAPIHTYEGVLTGDYKANELPVAQQLSLKKGAQVMMCRNDSNKRWVNGTLATVVELNEGNVVVQIGEEEYVVNPVEWEQAKYVYDKENKKLEKEIVGTYTQLPLRLAWAITIHKSQGMTFERMILDLRNGVFVAGQLYVALSRVKSLDGLYLITPIRLNYVLPKDQAIEFAEGFNDIAAISSQIQWSTAVYPYLRRGDIDGAVRAYYQQILLAEESGDRRLACKLADELLAVLIDDKCLATNELTKIKSILQDKETMNTCYLHSLMLYREGRIEEADKANVDYYGIYGRVFDSKSIFLLGRVNEALGDPAMPLYRRVVKDHPCYMPAYIALRNYLHAKGQMIEVDNEESKECCEDWNNAQVSNEEWVAKYMNLYYAKPMRDLRSAVMELDFETM